MAKRNFTEKLVKREDIKEELRLIVDSNIYYITPTGNIYIDYGNGEFYHMSTYVNRHNGYLYVNYKNTEGKMITRRVHRLVAIAYIPNPDNLPDVMHKDNNKENPNVENLKWGTVSENTRQAVNDGLLVNDKGFDDSQSLPVTMYDTLTNSKVCDYGSMREAAKECDITLSGISHQIKDNDEVLRKPFYFTLYNNPPRNHYVIVERDYKTDVEIGRYINSGDAHNKTGVNKKTISQQCLNGFKPKCLHKRNERQSYFSWEMI